MRKRVQTFIHRYYDTIRLVMNAVIFILAIVIFINQLNYNAAVNRARDEATMNIVRSIETETEQQTKIINRQFQALCFVIIEMSGEEALRELDPPLEEQCRNLAQELREQEAEEQAAGQPFDEEPGNATGASKPQPEREPAPQREGAQTQPEATTSPSDSEEPEEEPEPESLIDSLLRSLRIGGMV